jgi:hypothetical protein
MYFKGRKLKKMFLKFLFVFLSSANIFAASQTPIPTVLPSWIPTPQIIRSSNQTSKALSAKSGTSMLTGINGCPTITVDGLLNCPEHPDQATEVAAAVKVQVTPGRTYQITLLDGCIVYGSDSGDTLYGTRLRIRQADDTEGTNLTSNYNTVGYGAYNYGPVYTACADAQAVGFYSPYNPVTITASQNYLYFTPDDVYGGYCGDNSGTETVQIYLVPTLQDIWNSYDQQQNQISDLTSIINITAGTYSGSAQFFFKQPNKYKYLDTSLAGLEAAYNGNVLTTRDKISNVVHSMNIITPRIINKLDVMTSYRSLTNTSIDVSGIIINEKGQQSILLNIQFPVDVNTQSMYGTTGEQVVLFDYTEGIARQIIYKYNDITIKTTNLYYSLNNGILVPASRYMMDSNENTVSSETYNITGLNQGLPDNVFQVNP